MTSLLLKGMPLGCPIFIEFLNFNLVERDRGVL
jgi:hypothetical protein